MFASPRFALRTRAIWPLGLVLIAGALAPAVSLAQSAGDQQYADPLAQQEAPTSPAPNSGSQGNSGSGNSGAGTAPSAQQTPTAATQQDANANAAQTAPSGTQLPRTGLDVAPIAIAGAALFSAGLLLFWLAGPARRRRRREPIVLFHRLPPN